MPRQANDIGWFRELLRKSWEVEERDPAPVLEWLERQRSAAEFEAHLVGLSQLRGWSDDTDSGDIQHESGGFFSIQGVRVTASKGLREVDSWDQPIFTQKEGGILALIARQEGAQVQFLLNAKAEPGNIGTLQLAPTLQATWSNLKRAHKGRRPPFAEIILGEVRSRLVYESLHNEEGGRFWMKSNSNQIWLVDTTLTSLAYDQERFVWVSLSQIKAMSLVDNVLSPFVKTIVAPL